MSVESTSQSQENLSQEPVDIFLREAFKSDIDISYEKLIDLATEIDYAIEDIDAMRKSTQKDKDGKELIIDRQQLIEIFSNNDLYPGVASLLQRPHPDDDTLHAKLTEKIENNPKVREHTTVMFNGEGVPRKDMVNPLNVAKMLLLRTRPVIAYALEGNIRGAARLNRADEKELKTA